jgi:hypothetical protein
MNKSFRNILFISVILLIEACQTIKEVEEPKLEYEMASYEKEDCFGERCANVSFSYPFFNEEHPLAKTLNTHIEEQLKMYLQFGVFDDYESLDKAVEDYFLMFQEVADTSYWSVEVEGKVALKSDNILSLEFRNTSYTGHEEPSNHLLFLNFDLEDGNLLLRNDIVLDEMALLTMAEDAFRRKHAVAEGVSLAEDGRFFLEGEQFFLPFSMGYRDNDFVLFYNHYEICPYEMGATELTFPLEELDNVVLMQ